MELAQKGLQQYTVCSREGPQPLQGAALSITSLISFHFYPVHIESIFLFCPI